MITDRYNQRGVSADKEDVHNAIKNVDKGLFPSAFCKIVPDYLSGDKDYCLIIFTIVIDCLHGDIIRSSRQRASAYQLSYISLYGSNT